MAGAQEEVRMHTVCVEKSGNLLGQNGECVGEKGRGDSVEGRPWTAPVKTWNIVCTQEKGTVFVFKQLFYFLAQGDR